ncbi:4'-phosphopantetheinyl transferase [Desulfocicer vacuolatum DSM 3385]|uniref:4'-phosphopantetheinyl transferase n=1 Tax=Desulfocicer vacuolatum DSM 3385 TaxID=1121400 RepID=A0A1W2D860_9BACT|nr:4'-phosphopantetheinyl transferase superfamily protein [Desulfocicer vacuolatum]SMC93707.1 4'-phosphopantetheinyl transferase [Desulfocicer vacuolatum DSM 3385]
MLTLIPDENIHWSPEPDIIVRARRFSTFLLKTLRDPHGFHGFATRRADQFIPGDFIFNFLSPTELDTVNRFKSLKKQVEWMAGRHLVKEMVCASAPKGTNPWDITISYRDQGAPFLPRYPGVQISITHSGDYAAVALCHNKNKTMGLDLEEIGPVPDAGFMKLAFTKAEREYMGNDPMKIFRSWTLKEAFLKYIKKGFNESLHQVEILHDDILYKGTKTRVKLFCATIGPGYSISLVTDENHGPEI